MTVVTYQLLRWQNSLKANRTFNFIIQTRNQTWNRARNRTRNRLLNRYRSLKMMVFKIFLLTFLFGNGLALDLKFSDVKRGADNPIYDFQLSNLLKMLIKQKQMQRSVVISKKVKNQRAYELRKLLKRIKLGTMDQNVEPYQKKIQQKQNSRFNSYRRFHARNWLKMDVRTVEILFGVFQALILCQTKKIYKNWNKIDAFILKFCFSFACKLQIEPALNLSDLA